jgi:hypothetical protein
MLLEILVACSYRSFITLVHIHIRINSNNNNNNNNNRTFKKNIEKDVLFKENSHT